MKLIKGRDDFQWNKTDTYDVLVINLSNAFSQRDEARAKLYTRSQNRTVLKACHHTIDICTYLYKSTLLSKSTVTTLILELSNNYYDKILIMRHVWYKAVSPINKISNFR